AMAAADDKVHQGHAPVLELLGYRNHETNMGPDQLLLGQHVALERLPGELHLLFTIQQGHPRDLVEVQIETLTTLVYRPGNLGRAERTPLPARANCHVKLLSPMASFGRTRPGAVGPNAETHQNRRKITTWHASGN